MSELQTPPEMQDRSPLFTDPDKQQDTIKTVTECIHSLQVFYALMTESAPQKADAYTHLKLFENYLHDLSILTGYDSMLKAEFDRRYAEIRAANNRISDLESQIGSQTTPDAIASGMRHFENVFRAWYEGIGFRYGDIKFTNSGLTVNIDQELQNDNAKPRIADKTIYEAVWPYTVLITNDPAWDVDKDRFHSNLLDTDKNRTNILQLYTHTFPNASVHKFESYKESKHFYLRHAVHVPWADIDSLYKLIKAET